MKDGFILFLHVVVMFTGQPPGSGGRTLHEWVAETRDGLLALDPSVSSSLDEKLGLAGYDLDHRYDETFGLGACHLFRVQGGFPRIVPSMMPRGPSRVSYDIDLATCDEWRVDRAELDAAVAAAGTLR